ncbi:MAG: hypothetical protein GY835_18660, partial [bacterium]|nr:hypothetical protein [bacterium]
MFTFLARLAVACMLVLGGSAVQGQAPNQIFPPFQQNEAGSQPDRAGRGLATAAGPYDDAIVDLEVRDTLVYCGMGDGLMILNVSDPAVPEFVSRIYFQEGS